MFATISLIITSVFFFMACIGIRLPATASFLFTLALVWFMAFLIDVSLMKKDKDK